MDIISSTVNERVKSTRKLQQKKYREASGSYLIEGFHLLEEAILSGCVIRQIFVDESKVNKLLALASRLTHVAKGTVRESGQLRVDPVKISDSFNTIRVVTGIVLRSLSETEHPQGVVAEVEKSAVSSAFSPKGNAADSVEATEVSQSLTGNRYLVLENIQDPGNVGTLVRTADAAGFDGVICVGETADIYSGKVLRSMQGSHFHLQIVVSADKIYEALQSAGFTLLSTTLSAESEDYRTVSADRFVLILGNEGAGVSVKALSVADHKIHIPMSGKAESLNVAVAGGILMFGIGS